MTSLIDYLESKFPGARAVPPGYQSEKEKECPIACVLTTYLNSFLGKSKTKISNRDFKLINLPQNVNNSLKEFVKEYWVAQKGIPFKNEVLENLVFGWPSSQFYVTITCLGDIAHLTTSDLTKDGYLKSIETTHLKAKRN